MVFLDALTLNRPEIFIGNCASRLIVNRSMASIGADLTLADGAIDVQAEAEAA
jgi:hypothetical protein